MKPKILLPLLAATGLATAFSSAAIIATDNFTYTDGSLAGNTGGSGWSNGWSNLQGVPTVAGGEVVVDSTVGQQATRTLSTSQVKSSGGTVWFSMTGQMFTTGTGTTTTYGGLALFDGGTERLLLGKWWPGSYNWSANGIHSTHTLTLETQVYARLVFNPVGNDTLSVWLNPTDASLLESTAADITLNSANLSFDNVRLRGGVGTAVTESWNFDNLTLGTTLVDVIPEPSTPLLGMLALAIALARRSRRD